MSRIWIVIGDLVAGGGSVVTGSAFTDIDGKPVARIGDQAICLIHGPTVIATGDATMIIDGSPVARHGDMTACGCALMSVQQVHVSVASGGGGGATAAPAQAQSAPTGQAAAAPAPASAAGASASASPPPPAAGTIASQTVATSPPNRARLRIGVGEEVVVTVAPGPATWTVSAGATFKRPPGSAAQATLVAGDSTASVTVTATTSTGPLSLTFDIVEPSRWTMSLVPGLPKKHNHGIPDCGFAGRLNVLPADVNFYNMEMRELDSACVATGSYSSFNGVKHGRYPPPDHASGWFALAQHSAADGSYNPGMMDAIYSGYPGPVPMGAAPPFTPGAMHFDIVMQWRVVGSTTAPKNFGVQRQEHEVTAAGQCTTRKGGHSESFLFSDPSTGATW